MSTLQAIPDDMMALRVNRSNEQDVGNIDYESKSESDFLSDSDSDEDGTIDIFDD